MKNKNSILVVDDEKSNIVTLTQILSGDYVIYAAKSGQEAIETAKEHLPDIILLDILMSKMDGFEVLERLKNDEDTRSIPVIFVTGLSKPEDEEKGLALGAVDYITKPFNPTIVKLRIQIQIQILNQIEIIRRLSTTDQLTGISNRRNFDDRLYLEWDHAKRDKTPLSLFLFDLDNFKKYNDKYGHLQGDTALQIVAKVAEQALRRSLDFIGRWGGEEFVVLLPDTDQKGALIVAQNILKNIENIDIPCPNGEKTKVTLSIGLITQVPAKDSKITDFFNGADKALYEAKHTGKNKVCVFAG